MKTLVFTVGLALLLLLIFAAACGKGKHPAQTPLQPVSQEQNQQQDLYQLPVNPLTEEDYRLLAMSPEERWDYLFARYKDLVFQYHGVVLDYVPYPGKSASGGVTCGGPASTAKA